VLTYTIRRLLLLIPVALGVIILVSLMIHVVPGDPVDAIAGDFASELEKHRLREALGLNEPVWRQITSYIAGVFQGNLGTSLIYYRPVSELIFERIGPTLELAFISMVFAVLMSIPLGILSAIRAGTAVDYGAMGFALFGVAIPNFWLGPLLVLAFSLNLDFFPVSERGGWDSYILPAFTLGTALAAILTRMTRTTILENLQEDYVRTARAKGLSETPVLFKHVLRNAALPVVTLMGLQFGVLLTGAVITERIFDWPGLGTLILDGIGNRDYPVVQGCVLVFSGTYVLVNLLTDLLYGALDPRIQLDE
jgi:peptide/nickel transport system permease protein